MMPCKLVVLILALKKDVVFRDDLVKKLSGISLIQRAIGKAYEIGIKNTNIYLLTDSEEIRVIGERNNIQVYWEADLVWNEDKYITTMKEYFNKVSLDSDYTLLLSPYAPLLTVDLIKLACENLIDSGRDILKPIKQVKRHIYDENCQDSSSFQVLFGDKQETHNIESRAFTLIKSTYFNSNSYNPHSVLAWPIEHDLVEIESYQDWWVCEKLLARKRIVFRIIGNKQSGMGHIYRALSLAHEITDHEILFVSDTENSIAVNKLAGYDYWLGIYTPGQLVENIINLKPDLVINDILSTTENDVLPLQKVGIKVVNFEDLGVGAKLSDLTINELYDKPQFVGGNVCWGVSYFFVRDEFNDAKPHRFRKSVSSILLAFGGTDQHDLSRRIYEAINALCKQYKIHIHIVTGPGYVGYESLKNQVDSTVSISNSTGIISNMMEQSQIAIVSNGRTVYELAHMNIPAIVISQHSREVTHEFSCMENGFIPVGVYDKGKTEHEVVQNLDKLICDESFRKKMFKRTLKYKFSNNKKRVIKKILQVLE